MFQKFTDSKVAMTISRACDYSAECPCSSPGHTVSLVKIQKLERVVNGLKKNRTQKPVM